VWVSEQENARQHHDRTKHQNRKTLFVRRRCFLSQFGDSLNRSRPQPFRIGRDLRLARPLDMRNPSV